MHMSLDQMIAEPDNPASGSQLALSRYGRLCQPLTSQLAHHFPWPQARSRVFYERPFDVQTVGLQAQVVPSQR